MSLLPLLWTRNYPRKCLAFYWAGVRTIRWKLRLPPQRSAKTGHGTGTMGRWKDAIKASPMRESAVQKNDVLHMRIPVGISFLGNIIFGLFGCGCRHGRYHTHTQTDRQRIGIMLTEISFHLAMNVLRRQDQKEMNLRKTMTKKYETNVLYLDWNDWDVCHLFRILGGILKRGCKTRLNWDIRLHYQLRLFLLYVHQRRDARRITRYRTRCLPKRWSARQTTSYFVLSC